MPYKRKEDQAAASNRYYYKNKKKVMALNNNNKSRNKEFRKSILEKSSCVDCGIKDIRVLEFDHVRGEKLYTISSLVNASNSLKMIKEEMAKCEIRCRNCHMIVTLERLRRNAAVKC